MSSSTSLPLIECKCGLPLMMLTSWTRETPARRFGVCPNKYLENKRYRDQEELAILQVEFADIEGQMQQSWKN
ncbi:hypothetical protein Tco_0055843 [Tanacetum coccineum]